jgi:hypothetical protein
MTDVPVTDPRTHRASLSPDLAEFLVKACAPDRADRYLSASGMRLALCSIRADL